METLEEVMDAQIFVKLKPVSIAPANHLFVPDLQQTTQTQPTILQMLAGDYH